MVRSRRVQGIMRGFGRPAASGALATVLLLALPWMGSSAISESALGNPVQITEYLATSLNVSWAAAPASYRYDLRWRPAGAAEYAAGKELSGNVTHYFVAGLLAGTQYEMLLQLRAMDGATGEELGAVAETLSTERATNVRAVAVGAGDVSVEWEPVASAAMLSQKLYVSKDGGATWAFNEQSDEGPLLTPTGRSERVYSLRPLTSYAFRIDSIFSGAPGAAPSLPSASVSTLPATPSTPVGLRALNLTSTSAVLSWESLSGAVETGATSVVYLVEWGDDPGGAFSDAITIYTGSSIQVFGLLRGAPYRFRVSARNDAGLTSAPTNWFTFSSEPAVPRTLPAPSVAASDAGLLVSWALPVSNEGTGGSPITGFVVIVRREDEAVPSVGINVGLLTSYSALSLTANYRYAFAVTASNIAGPSLRSNESAPTVPPDTPAMLRPTATVNQTRGTDITLAWGAPALASNVLAYRVFVRQLADFTDFDAGVDVPSMQTKFVFSNLPDRTQFFFKVQALTPAGYTDDSPAAFAETRDDFTPTEVAATLTTGCVLTVTWTAPRTPVLQYRVFSEYPGLPGGVQDLTGSTATTFSPSLCVAGATYTFKVQAVFGASGSLLSRPSLAISVPVTVPARPNPPTLTAGPQPATSITISWAHAPLGSAAADAVVTRYKLLVASSSSSEEYRFNASGTDTSLVVSFLGKAAKYLARIQAVNALGESQESLSSLITTGTTDPDKVGNLTVDAASESVTGDAITLYWSVPDSGGAGNVDDYRIFPYSVGRDYDPGVSVTGTTSSLPTSSFRVTGLSGGIDYNFIIRAYKGARVSVASERVAYRTRSVVPRAITSLNVYPAANADQKYTYKVDLTWNIPIDAETTGGVAITGFVLEFAELTGCESCSDTNQACVSQRQSIPWESTDIGVAGVLGAVSAQTLTMLKGSTYIFRLRAINSVGLGSWWPTSCLYTDANCFGARVGTNAFTCFDPIVTQPTALVGFGDWAESTPGALPLTTTSVQLIWAGHDYNNQSINGGLPIVQLEIQRTKKANPQWPLDHYCPTLPEPLDDSSQPVCLYAQGCTPQACVATCPMCLSAISGEAAFNAKTTTDFAAGIASAGDDASTVYLYRIRFSNEMPTCSNKAPSVGSSFTCVWSDFSASAEVMVMQDLKFSNIKVRGVHSTSIEILWQAPSSNDANQADVGDKANIYYGLTATSVITDPFTGSTVVFGPDSFETGGNKYNTHAVTGLVPATTYYFSVVGYYSAGNTEVPATRSEVSKSITTPVGIPAQVINVTAISPPAFIDKMAGAILVEWAVLYSACGSGSFLTDGSVAGCQRGEASPLVNYKVYYKLDTEPNSAYKTIITSGSGSRLMIRGLIKENLYSFTVSATNSRTEGIMSLEATAAPVATAPGEPPRPLVSASSPLAVRLSWAEPTDKGTQNVTENTFILILSPRRDGLPGNETLIFAVDRSTILTGLDPNSLYTVVAQFQANPLYGFGLFSPPMAAFTTPSKPANLAVAGGGTNISTKVGVTWAWAGVQQGNVTITGYKLNYQSTDGLATGVTYCSGGATRDCSLDGFKNGKTYSITIAASNDPRLETNFGPISDPLSVDTPGSLPNVYSVATVRTTAYSAVVSWVADGGGQQITALAVRTKRENEPWGLPENVVGPAIQTTVKGLGANLYYAFILVVSNSLGYTESAPSDQALTLPAPVPRPTLSSISSYTASLSWPPWYGKNALEGYRVQYRINDGPGVLGAWTLSGSTSQLSFTVSALLPNMGYDLRVAAYNAAGTGEYGDYIAERTPAAPPNLVYVSLVGAGFAVLNWEAQPGAGLTYRVHLSRYTDSVWSDEPYRVKGNEGEIDTFNVTGLVKGATYKFGVTSTAGEGAVGALSPFSHEVRTLLSTPNRGPTPRPSNPGETSMAVSWDAVSSELLNGGSPITGYTLEYRGFVLGAWDPWAPKETSASRIRSVTGLLPSVQYEFRVKSVNALGAGLPGPASDALFTIPGLLDRPSQQAFLRTILVTFSVPEFSFYDGFRINFAGYDLESDPPNWFPWKEQVLPASTSTVKYDALEEDSRYRIKLAARNPSGWGTDSPIVETRTTLIADPWTLFDDGSTAMNVADSTLAATSATLQWFGPAIGTNADSLDRRGSATGFQVIACLQASGSCDIGIEYFETSCFLSHKCGTSPPYTFQRQGLLKNTQYYFELAVVNPGGPGPRSRPSPVFRTLTSYPIQMQAPAVVSTGDDSILVTWDPVTDWNERGGLDITTYVLFKREDGSAYSTGELVYEGSSFQFTRLPSNTKYFFAMVSENTECTTCPSVGACFFPICCDDHSCTAKSFDSPAVSTRAGKMPTPRLSLATIFDIHVTWDPLPGTPNNVFTYKLRFRDIDRASQLATGEWVTREFAGSLYPTGYPLFDLDTNNRYEVRISANNQFGYGVESDAAILSTKAKQVMTVRFVDVRATEISLEWEAPPGRQKNIVGYNITYRRATYSEVMHGTASETLPLSYVLTPTRDAAFSVINLSPNASYVFSIAAINGGGLAQTSAFTPPRTTMAQDLLGACRMYPLPRPTALPVASGGASGSILLQESGNGTTTLQGLLTGLSASSVYRLEEHEYGNSLSGVTGSVTFVSTITTDASGAVTLDQDVPLKLTGLTSAIGRALVIKHVSSGVPVGQCDVGLARPRSGAFLNAALPSTQSRGFCTLIPRPGLNLRGSFIVSPTDRGLRLRGRICGLAAVGGGSSSFEVGLWQYGDVGQVDAPPEEERVDVALGFAELDNIGSGNFDLLDSEVISFAVGTPASLIGRALYIFDGARDAPPLAACVIGAHDPANDATVFAEAALPPACTPCTWTLGLQESLYTLSNKFGNDWVSVWSLNAGNPDKARSGTSVYYAHPYTLQSGEDMASVKARFAISDSQIAKLNNNRLEYVTGETVCVSLDWTRAVDKEGRLVCRASEEMLAALEEDQSASASTIA